MSRKRPGKRGPGKEPSEAAPPPPARASSRRRWILRLAALLVAGAAALLWAFQQRPKGLIIDNQSGEPISSLRVTAVGKTTAIREVPSGEKVTIPFGTGGDDQFTFEGELRGRKIQGRGKATEGLTVVIQADGNIKFQQAAR